MSEIFNLLTKIENHTTQENKGHHQPLSIGVGEIVMKGMSAPKVIWILNSEPTYSYDKLRNITGDVVTTGTANRAIPYKEPGSDCLVIGKNKNYARLILQNYEGTHTCMFCNGNKSFLIKNSAHYVNCGRSVINIYAGIAGNEDWSYFTNLQDAIDRLRRTNYDIELYEQQRLEAQRQAEQIRKRQREEAERLAREEAHKLEEAARKAEEEERRLQEEIREAELKRQSIIEEAKLASAFIRQQVSLKRNPVLDKNQDKAKFSNIYNGVTEIINGGPGTGKTTTMIQRLKLLIDKSDLEDYRSNNSDCKLTTEQLDIISSTADNWVYFSPNDLLKKYLQDNMSYEGLSDVNNRTTVWKDFLKDAVRDYYHLAGQDCPFDFAKKKVENKAIYSNNHFVVIESFTNFYIHQIKERILKIANLNVSKFEWRFLGSIIVNECKKIDTIRSIPELLSFFINLESIDTDLFANGKEVKKGAEIHSEYNLAVRQLASKYVVLLKRDDRLYNEAVEYIKSLEKAPQTESEDIEETEEVESDYGDQTIALENKVNSLLKKLILKKRDSSTKLTTQQDKLHEFIKRFISEEELENLSDAAFFSKNVYPVLRGFSQFMLSPIPTYYKQFRKIQKTLPSPLFDKALITEIIQDYKNKPLLFQEQAMLIGFINNIAINLYRNNKLLFEKSNHKYIQAYKDLCKPVIGIDEATDYSIIDFYGIKSFGHYAVCSYTLIGDTMQLMKEDGIRDWSILQHPLLFNKIDIQNLTMSYRQSPELLSLAGKIYKAETGNDSPYKCFLKSGKTPKPLWFESDDIDEKAEWISERVMEITKVYNCMPTIAIFTVDKQRAEGLKYALEDCDNLSNAGIDVKVCSDNTLEGEKTLRIFPIDQVKGMEFEAVFFYDIDEIESTALVNKYLYVGLSRASMYLAVTTYGGTKVSDTLKAYFPNVATW